MQVCTSLQTDNHASTPPLCFLQAGCPSCRPTNSVKALKALFAYREMVKSFKCGKSAEGAKEGEDELSANAVIRREYVKLGNMT